MVFLDGIYSIGVVLIMCNNQMLWQKGSQKQQKECNKVFSFGNMSCALRNSQVIKLKQNQDVETGNLINYPSSCQDNLIRKIFELQFPHHTVTIHDLLTISYNPHPLAPHLQHTIKNDNKNQQFQNSTKKDQNKKLVLFRSKVNRDTSQIKGDKKNIAKNVVTAFMNYLREGKHEGENFEPQIEVLKTLIDKTKYNNQLITFIVSSPELRTYFRSFLNSSAVSWIQHSKLKNKQIHIEAIELYERLCDEKQSKTRQNDQKSRREIQLENDENEYLFQSGINHDLEDQIKDFK